MEYKILKGRRLNRLEEERLNFGDKVIIGSKIFKKNSYGRHYIEYITLDGDTTYLNPTNVYEYIEVPKAELMHFNNDFIMSCRTVMRKPKFNWNYFKNNEVAINCETEEEAKVFIKMCNENEIRRRGTCWDRYKEQTCYNYDKSDNSAGYCDYKYYRGHDYQVVKFSDFDFTEDIKPVNEKGNIKFRIKDDNTYVTIGDKSGKATRNNIDQDNRELGILIATARALGVDEKIVNAIVDAEYGKKKTIKDFSNEELLEELRNRL